MALANKFAMAYTFFALFGVWSLIFWLTSDTLAKRRRWLRSRSVRRHPNELRKCIREYRAVKWLTVGAVVGISAVFMAWTKSAETDFINSQPRADLYVDSVTIEVKYMGTAIKHPYPYEVVAHISGHNQSYSAATLPYPILKAALAVRPFITGDHLDREEELFTRGKWANEAYVGLPYVLNPRQRFSFSKTDSFITIDAQAVANAGNEFLDTWNALQRGDVVLYVVTRAIYRDKWGVVPEVRSCRWFSASDDFKIPMTCSGQFKSGTYQP